MVILGRWVFLMSEVPLYLHRSGAGAKLAFLHLLLRVKRRLLLRRLLLLQVIRGVWLCLRLRCCIS